MCVELAERTESYLDVSGYLHVGDDTFILHKSPILRGPFDKIWLKQNFLKYNLATRYHSEWGLPMTTNCKPSYWLPWHLMSQITAAKQLLKYLRESKDLLYSDCALTLEKELGTKDIIYHHPTIQDFVYIPRKKLQNYITLMKVFSKFRIIFETPLPNVVKCIDPDGSNTLNARGINHLKANGQSYNVERSPNIFIQKALNEDMTHVHPIKLASLLKLKKRMDKEKRNTMKQSSTSMISDTFCNHIMPYIYS